jgi:hypothetical protein
MAVNSDQCSLNMLFRVRLNSDQCSLNMLFRVRLNSDQSSLNMLFKALNRHRQSDTSLHQAARQTAAPSRSSPTRMLSRVPPRGRHPQSHRQPRDSRCRCQCQCLSSRSPFRHRQVRSSDTQPHPHSPSPSQVTLGSQSTSSRRDHSDIHGPHHTSSPRCRRSPPRPHRPPARHHQSRPARRAHQLALRSRRSKRKRKRKTPRRPFRSRVLKAIRNKPAGVTPVPSRRSTHLHVVCLRREEDNDDRKLAWTVFPLRSEFNEAKLRRGDRLFTCCANGIKPFSSTRKETSW